ncbi:hypothetical protein SK128_026557 [Halocaridina rubra]|uniref:Uncharacterized protein n=1 Tax=Halocaridina rubra TaxID=373956 RepID=A0AAN9A703_HALRR
MGRYSLYSYAMILLMSYFIKASEKELKKQSSNAVWTGEVDVSVRRQRSEDSPKRAPLLPVDTLTVPQDADEIYMKEERLQSLKPLGAIKSPTRRRHLASDISSKESPSLWNRQSRSSGPHFQPGPATLQARRKVWSHGPKRWLHSPIEKVQNFRAFLKKGSKDTPYHQDVPLIPVPYQPYRTILSKTENEIPMPYVKDTYKLPVLKPLYKDDVLSSKYIMKNSIPDEIGRAPWSGPVHEQLGSWNQNEMSYPHAVINCDK